MGAAATGSEPRRSGPAGRDGGSADLLLVHGDDRFLVDDEVRRWRAAAGAEMGVDVVDPPAPIERIRAVIAETPFIDPRRYLLIRDPPQLGGRRGDEGARALATALELRAPTTSVCLVCHETVPASHPVTAAVTRLGGRVLLFRQLRGRDLREWADRAAAARGLRLQPGGVEHILRVAGSDLGIVSAELDKLTAHAGGEIVDLETVRLLTGGSETLEVWAVLERLLGPRPGLGAAAVADLVEEGRSTQHLIATLAGQLHELRQVQGLVGSGTRGARLAERLRIPEWRAERLARQAGAVSPALVEDWLRQLQRLDAAIKRGDSNDRNALQGFALGAARALTSQRRAARAKGRDGARAGVQPG
ncbi:MAG: DNA polymerase III subunit delta [Candidatus Dormibacteria bacterium]|jgi:DNA polymerase-3 subunit delta